MPVVVVESPAKAKTINKYLGPNYTVLASFGHVRDLPPKDGSVDTENDFEMLWEVAADSKKHVRAIAEALKTDNELILATDPDREGEAISWHLQEALHSSLKKGKTVSRVTFNAITKDAVTEAMKHPRQVDMPLVDAYLARRALDYLVGFNLSPVLWRKLPGSRSAGRVQSVCLRLIVDREMEIEAFRAREFWSVTALLTTPRGQSFAAKLTHLAGKKLDKFDIASAEAADLAATAVRKRDLTVQSVEAKPASRNPYPPFMTSTLQQEASRKFGMGAKACMSAAQRLYEAGHITYMRTDGIDMAPEAVAAARGAIAARFGASYVPEQPRLYKNKAKNAQEAHECIRPTDMNMAEGDLGISDGDQRRLYDLIWKRTIASQMASARLERTAVDLASADGAVVLRASGQVVLFDGFLKVYDEGRDDEDEDEARLPQLMQGEAVAKQSVTEAQHFTQAPPRYSEATLVKRMEELGIGRPSTYASVLSTIVDREYVKKEKNRLIPEDKGRLVTAFLTNFFRRYVEYDFTADLESQLDDVSAGTRDYKGVLRQFWRDFSAAIADTADLRIGEVLDKIDEFLSPHLYPLREDGSDPRICQTCGSGRLHLKTSRTGGAFIGCGNYPDCRYTRPISGEEGGSVDGRVLGADADGVEISLRAGRFGPYVQKGEATADNPKPPRASLPKTWAAESLTLERAIELLTLPRLVGSHPDDGQPVEAAIGRFGPYIKHGALYANLPDVEDVFTIGMNRAVEVLAQKLAGRRGGTAAPPLRELGTHPAGGFVQVMEGKYGPYVKWAKVNATLPKEVSVESITLEEALALIAEKIGKKGGGKKPAAAKAAPKAAASKTAAKTPAAKSAAKKPAAKDAAKKPAAKKPAAKKPSSAKATKPAAKDSGPLTE
jgi:DNA topoisomerase I